MGLAFKAVLYKTEDLCDCVWNGRPEWARPAVGGIALRLLLLAIRRCTGSATPYMYKTAAGGYVLWFLILLAFAKIAATPARPASHPCQDARDGEQPPRPAISAAAHCPMPHDPWLPELLVCCEARRQPAGIGRDVFGAPGVHRAPGSG